MNNKDTQLIWEAWTNEQLGRDETSLTDREQTQLKQTAPLEFTDDGKPEFFEFDGVSGQGGVYAQNAAGDYHKVYFTWDQDGEYEREYRPRSGGGQPGEEPFIASTTVYNIIDPAEAELEETDPMWAAAQRMIEDYFDTMGLRELGYHYGAEEPHWA